MKTIDEYRQSWVTNLIEQGARIDILVVESRQVAADVTLDHDQETAANALLLMLTLKNKRVCLG